MKKPRPLLYVLFAGSALILALVLFLVIDLDRLVEKRIRKALESEPLKGHTIGFSGFRFSPSEKGFEIDSLYILPGTLLNGQDRGQPHVSTINLQVGKIKVSGINYLGFLVRKVLRVDKISVSDPAVMVVMVAAGGEEGGVVQRETLLKDTAKSHPFLRKILVDEFDLINGSIHIYDGDIRDPIYGVEGLGLLIGGIDADLTELKDPREAISFKRIKVTAHHQVVHLPGGFYDLEVGSLGVGDSGSLISIDSIRLIPLYSKKEFGYRFGRQMDRFDVSVRQVLIREFDLRRMLRDKKFMAGSVDVSGVRADIHRDKNIPRKNEKIKPLLNEMVLKVKMPLALDTVRFSDAFIRYGEVPEEESEAGVIFIDEFNLSVTNVTNIPQRISDNNVLELEGNFMLEGVGPTAIQLSFPLDDPSRQYSYVLEMQGMELPKLNPMLKPSANIDIRQGTMVRASFEITATTDSAWGKAYMKYYGLDMEILRKKPKDKDREVKRFLSKIANSLIHRENPAARTGVERVGLIAFERDKYKSQVGFLVKPVLQGIVRVIAPLDGNVEKKGEEVKERRRGKK